MKHELKIFRAPCTCAKCKPTDRNAEARLLVAPAKAEKPAAKVVGTMADYAKAIAALITEGKWESPWAPDPPDLNALIRENAPKVSPVPPTQANGVPNPPDLNEAIRRAAKEKN